MRIKLFLAEAQRFTAETQGCLFAPQATSANSTFATNVASEYETGCAGTLIPLRLPFFSTSLREPFF
jgi:hypothetical protein